MNNHFKKILIIRLSAVGDVVNVLPALRVLRESHPNAHLAWLVEDRTKDIISGNPDLDEVIVFPRKKWQKEIANPITVFPAISEAVRFFKSLRNKDFDLVIDFQGNLKSGLITILSRGRVRLGFDNKTCKEWNHLFTNLHGYIPTQRIHRIDKNLNLLKAININSGYKRPHLNIPVEDKEFISEFLRQNIKAEKPLAVIHPGTSDFGEYKRWPVSHYARLADLIIEKLGVNVIFTWGLSELDMVREIVSQMRQHAVISCKTRSLKQLAEIIRQSDIFISGDTGPMHIASIMDKPIVAIFGPKDPIIYGPYAYSVKAREEGDGTLDGFSGIARVVRKDMPCSPCKKRSCKNNACIKTISSDQVFQSVAQLLTDLQN